MLNIKRPIIGDVSLRRKTKKCLDSNLDEPSVFRIKKQIVILKKYFERNQKQDQIRDLCTMHLTHKAGEMTFIDFSGKTVDIVNPENGVITKSELFIGCG